MVRHFGITLALLCSALFSPLAVAVRAVPSLTSPVVDEAGVFSAEERASLANSLIQFANSRGSQLVALTVDTLEGEAIESFALRVAEAWKIGRKEIDDGAILVVAVRDRQVRIEVGYGLEGGLNDATSKRIIEELIIPEFRAGNIPGGIRSGLVGIQKVIEEEPLPAPALKNTRQTGAPSSANFLIFFLIACLALGRTLKTSLGAGPGAFIGGIGVAILVTLFSSLLFGIVAGMFMFIVTLFGGMGMGRSGYYGSGWGGGSGRGSGGGGSFGGGGGSFGGGGASGRW